MLVAAYMGSKSFLHCHKVLKGQRVFYQSEPWHEEFKGSFFRTDPARGANFQCLLGKDAKSRQSNKGLAPGLVEQDSWNRLPNSFDAHTLHLENKLMN